MLLKDCKKLKLLQIAVSYQTLKWCKVIPRRALLEPKVIRDLGISALRQVKTDWAELK